MTYEQSLGSVKTLRNLWNSNVSQTLWSNIGGLERFQQAQVLFYFVRQHEKNPDKARLFLESQEAFAEFVRSVWRSATASRPPHRSKQEQQPAREHSDTLQVVSQLFTCGRKTPWNSSGWEDGIPRVASGVSHRTDRLKALGNAVVPQIPELIGRAIISQP